MVYFISDFHLGSPDSKSSKEREKDICRWLDYVKKDAIQIYFLGDIFDFWFEYKYVVPRGYARFLGKLCELHDLGIELHLCVGNHDLWIRDYLETECGLTIFKEPKIIEIDGLKLCVHHGDGLGPGDKKYKFLKSIFTNGFAQWLFTILHPNIGFFIATRFSKKSRKSEKPEEKSFKGMDKEFLVLYSESFLKQEHLDAFIFGHRHLQLDILLSNGKSRYINLGEWFKGRRYVRVGGGRIDVLDFD